MSAMDLVVLLLFSILVVSTRAWASNKLVERIRVGDFDPVDYYKNGPVPLLIEGTLSLPECEDCCDLLLQNAGGLSIALQRQNHENGGATDIYEGMTLSRSLDFIMLRSNSRDAYMAFCEGLLNEKDDLEQIQILTREARERVFDDADWFQHFPPDLRPSDAVILAGAGATSTLHRDPFEWTGTSLCIEGSKLWRFIDPGNDVGIIDDALNAYRLDSIAWKEGRSLSAGWQSDFSLFRHRDHEQIPPAVELSELKDEERTEILREISMQHQILKEEVDGMEIRTAIQKTGDLLLIPAHWWHQTYGPEPSAAIASQRCGDEDSAMVLQHILDHNQIDAVNARSILDSSGKHPEKAIWSLFSTLDDILHLA